MNAQLIVSICSVLVALLITSGAVTFFFRYGIRMAIVERVTTDKHKELADAIKNQVEFHGRLMVLEGAVAEIKSYLPELKKINTMVEQLDRIAKTLEQVVLRPELEARLETLEQAPKLKQRKSVRQ